MILGVDCSHWQGKPDWNKAGKAGVRFAIIKAGEVLVLKPNKSLYYDNQHDRNIAKIKEAGIISGDYYYFHPSAGASKQARHYAEIYLKSKPDLPPVIDVEDTDKMKPLDVQKQLMATIDAVREKTGRREIIIYSRNGFIVNQMGDPDWDKDIWFWIARYASKIGDLSPKIKDRVAIWQYTDKLKLPGLPTMDGNYWLKDENLLHTLAGKAEPLDRADFWRNIRDIFNRINRL